MGAGLICGAGSSPRSVSSRTAMAEGVKEATKKPKMTNRRCTIAERSRQRRDRRQRRRAGRRHLAGGLVLKGRRAARHKVALSDIAEGRRCAATTWRSADRARRPSLAGPLGARSSCWRAARRARPDNLPIADAPRRRSNRWKGFTFQGFRNADGSVGTRNLLAITTTVQCVAGVVEHAVERIRRELLPLYPHVDDVVGLEHGYGCGVAIDAPDAVIPIRTLRHISLNPNFGGEVMVVSLG